GPAPRPSRRPRRAWLGPHAWSGLFEDLDMLFAAHATGRNALFAVGRAPVERAIAFGEMRRRREAAGERHVDYRHVGLQQQQPGLLQTQFQIVALGRPVYVADRKSV